MENVNKILRHKVLAYQKTEKLKDTYMIDKLLNLTEESGILSLL